MSKVEQLTLFAESREERLEREVIALRSQCDKVRKSQYAKISEVKKIVTELQYELDALKTAICRTRGDSYDTLKQTLHTL